MYYSVNVTAWPCGFDIHTSVVVDATDEQDARTKAVLKFFIANPGIMEEQTSFGDPVPLDQLHC